LRTAPPDNHRQAKILTPYLQVSRFHRSLSLSVAEPVEAGLAQSFCLPPRNPPYVVFFLSHFLQNGKKRRLHSNHHRAALAPEKK